MPEYLAPGVYVEEIQTGPRPIEGVSTSTAGFVGETERGPTRPTLVTSWTDYQRTFGGYIDQPPLSRSNGFLPYAARGFFDNGGQRLFVARVVGPNATPATGDLGNCLVEAIGEGPWGNNLLVAVSKVSVADAGPLTANWFSIRVAYYRDGVPQDLVDPTDIKQPGNPKQIEPTVFENFDNLSAVSTDANFAMSVINAGSQLIKVLACTAKPTEVNFPGVRLQNGASQPATLTEYLDEEAQDPEKRAALPGCRRSRKSHCWQRPMRWSSAASVKSSSRFARR